MNTHNNNNNNNNQEFKKAKKLLKDIKAISNKWFEHHIKNKLFNRLIKKYCKLFTIINLYGFNNVDYWISETTNGRTMLDSSLIYDNDYILIILIKLLIEHIPEEYQEDKNELDYRFSNAEINILDTMRTNFSGVNVWRTVGQELYDFKQAMEVFKNVYNKNNNIIYLIEMIENILIKIIEDTAEAMWEDRIGQMEEEQEEEQEEQDELDQLIIIETSMFGFLNDAVFLSGLRWFNYNNFSIMWINNELNILYYWILLTLLNKLRN